MQRKDAISFLARGLSATAALVCVVAFVAILVSGTPEAPAAPAVPSDAAARLQATQARLARALAVLEDGGDARRARRALGRARAANGAIARELKRAEAAGLATDTRLADAVAAHREYLDASAAVARGD